VSSCTGSLPQERRVVAAYRGRDVVDQPVHPVELVEHERDRLADLEAIGVGLQHLEVAAADRDRRSELVRDRGHERGLHVGELLQSLGDLAFVPELLLGPGEPRRTPGQDLADHDACGDRDGDRAHARLDVTGEEDEGHEVRDDRERCDRERGPRTVREPDPDERDDEEDPVGVFAPGRTGCRGRSARTPVAPGRGS
jgi:hypothetical protein